MKLQAFIAHRVTFCFTQDSDSWLAVVTD